MKFFTPLLLLPLAWGCVAPAGAQTNVDYANLRADVNVLQQNLSGLSLQVEQLQRQVTQLQSQAGQASQAYATLDQLNQSIAQLNQTLNAALASQKSEVLSRVDEKLKALARQTQAALDALAKNLSTRPAVSTTFNDSYSKEGVTYTVQKGDTLARIAKKTGGRVQDIINANKITDPALIQVGQTLFIPQSKN